jgi:class 3 adenylate cyclase
VSIRNLASPLPVETLAEIRHDLRNFLNQIIGYGEIVGEAAEELKLPPGMEAAGEICSSAKGILATLRASASARVTTRHLQALGIRVADSSALMIAKLDYFKNVEVEGQSELASDLARLRKAIEALRDRGNDLRGAEPAITVQQPVQPVPVPVTAPSRDVEALPPGSVSILVVDDNEGNRELLSRKLLREGFGVTTAADGHEVLAVVKEKHFDIVLLDLMMPGIDGIEILRRMRADSTMKDIAVIVISAVDEMSSIVRCIEMGAADYLSKPFDSVLLMARIAAILERKRLADLEKRTTQALQKTLDELAAQQALATNLLLNILPERVAEELREKGSVDPMYFEDVTIVFTDFVGFSRSTECLSAEELVYLLDEYVTAFDGIIARYQLEKLKTVGDSYIYLAGVPTRSSSHPVDAVWAAFEIVEFVKSAADAGKGPGWEIRIGIHTGPVIAGVVGTKKFAFDVWGETVNFAARMESSGLPNRINLSDRSFARVKDFFACEHRGKVKTKEGRDVDMYLAEGLVATLSAGATGPGPTPAFLRRYKTYFQKQPPAFPPSLTK